MNIKAVSRVKIVARFGGSGGERGCVQLGYKNLIIQFPITRAPLNRIVLVFRFFAESINS
jgi:hypothetical protein